VLSLSQGPVPPDVWVYGGDANGDEMGYAVGTAGDVNGDGYDDFVAGAPGDNLLVNGVYREGTVSLFYGGPAGLASLPDWEYGSQQQGSRLGAAVASAGYVDDDPNAEKRFADLVVGAPDYKNGITKVGAAMVFYGSAGGLGAAPDWTYVSPQRDSKLGNAVAGGGNLNGDGYDDLIVGAQWYSDTLSKEGAALIFYGSEDGLPDAPDLVLPGGQAGAGLGSAVAGGGDVNGDGYHDVLAGAPFYNGGQGAVFLYLGGPEGLETTPAWTAYGEEAGARLGWAVTWAGNLNGDAYDDLVVGAPGDVLRVNVGTLYVYYGSPTGPGPEPDLVVRVGQTVSGFGASLARAGDMDGDGFEEVLAGASLWTDDQKEEGGAFLYFGSAAGLGEMPGWTGWGDKAETRYGFAVGAAGLADSKEFRSIAVGAPTFKLDGKTPLGRAFVYYGPLEPRARSTIYLPLIVQPATP
jgi:hypothetical protein